MRCTSGCRTGSIVRSYRAGFVVGAGGAGSAEGLLADDGAGRLVVDVEVAGGVLERRVGFGDGPLVGGEDRAGEAVDGGLVGEPQRVGPVGVVIDVGGE